MRKNNSWINALMAAMAAAALGGCGGGGSSAGSTATVIPAAGTTFPLQTAIAQLYATGYQKSAAVSGTAAYAGTTYPVSGLVTLTMTPGAGSTSFAGQTALPETTSVSGSVTVNGQTVNLASSEQGYLSSNYAPLGYTTPTTYCTAATPSTYPAQVSVGQTGTVVTYDCYTNSSMSVATGTETLGYVVKASNSATTATVSVIDTFVNTANQQTFSATDNYTIDTSGSLTLVSEAATETVSGALLNLSLVVQ